MKRFNFIRRQPRAYTSQRKQSASERALPLALIQAKRKHAINAGENVLSAILGSLEQGMRGSLSDYFAHIESLFDIVQMADEAIRLVHDLSATRQDKPYAERNKAHPSQSDTPSTEPAVSSYLVSSWFLAKCHNYLTSQANGHERLHLVTGIKLNANKRTLDHMIKVDLSSESAINATADQHDLQKALIKMDDWGHSLHGLFHSHPGTGVQATQPSSLDVTTHHRYESGGYPLIGAIFVKDGHVRFFSNLPFTITIYGTGVTQIDKHIFTIHLSNQTSTVGCK